MSGSAGNREKIVDTIVLAISNSQLRETADESGLRALAGERYDAMTSGGSLDLQVLWDALQDKPGFNWDAGVAPMCAIKQREDRLGINVVMPAHLDIMAAEEIARRAAECTIPSAEPAKAATSGDFVVSDNAPAASGWRAMLERKEVVIGVLALAVVALGFIGYTVFGYFSSGSWDSFRAGDIEGGIPIASTEKLGRQVGMQLSDDAWLGAPEAQRRGQLEAALRSLEAHDIEVVFVKDRGGRPRASAQWVGTSIKTRFME